LLLRDSGPYGAPASPIRMRIVVNRKRPGDEREDALGSLKVINEAIRRQPDASPDGDSDLPFPNEAAEAPAERACAPSTQGGWRVNSLRHALPALSAIVNAA
jgi:hypothetical protein